MRQLNALFELAVALAAFAFFACSFGELLAPATHPQWRFCIMASLLVGFIALACFASSLRRIRLEAAKNEAGPPNG